MNLKTYTLLDMGHGMRLEQWGPYRLVRPDPTAVSEPLKPDLWETADAVYEGEKGKGRWKTRTDLPTEWPVAFDDLWLSVRLAPYKHTGVFPEQADNWRFARSQAKKAGRPLTVLNLFAYTGGATVALAKDGHFVTHVDASKPAINWAKDNAILNHLPQDRIRWMLEDAPLFATRERKRGKRYDAIILDPPAFGHAPSGKTWRVERDLPSLLDDCAALLSDDPAFLILNGYARNAGPEHAATLLREILQQHKKRVATVDAKELALNVHDGRALSTGVVVRVVFER
jgi:23S rRNA (cytosine1962-C5)-methyltransferase